jgi:hypothetical protein
VATRNVRQFRKQWRAPAIFKNAKLRDIKETKEKTSLMEPRIAPLSESSCPVLLLPCGVHLNHSIPRNHPHVFVW